MKLEIRRLTTEGLTAILYDNGEAKYQEGNEYELLLIRGRQKESRTFYRKTQDQALAKYSGIVSKFLKYGGEKLVEDTEEGQA